MLLEDRILEMCKEDDYGCWELWWTMRPFMSGVESSDAGEFVKCISKMCDLGYIYCKTRRRDSVMEKSSLEVGKLLADILNLTTPLKSEDGLYWFGV